MLFAFYCNEARKEVVYLCGNFSEGVTQESVLRQLNTLHLANFSVTENDSNSLIVMDSKLTLGAYRCVIEINEQGRVSHSYLE